MRAEFTAFPILRREPSSLIESTLSEGFSERANLIRDGIMELRIDVMVWVIIWETSFRFGQVGDGMIAPAPA